MVCEAFSLVCVYLGHLKTSVKPPRYHSSLFLCRTPCKSLTIPDTERNFTLVMQPLTLSSRSSRWLGYHGGRRMMSVALKALWMITWTLYCWRIYSNHDNWKDEGTDGESPHLSQPMCARYGGVFLFGLQHQACEPSPGTWAKLPLHNCVMKLWK